MTSVDGISVDDLISRRAMLEGLFGVDESVLPSFQCSEVLFQAIVQGGEQKTP